MSMVYNIHISSFRDILANSLHAHNLLQERKIIEDVGPLAHVHFPLL